ncbi:hypothetical protein E4U22_000312 [Claviceps purpurea]|nr:hypothetical protein E4U37_008230 [Claviceps purpurea]KAG6149283.1 hypothetical protein E4U11_000201 [Claviceps purpurea]KAG6216107.1 hypothetical protein E4U26_008242 [Claviceps purpurea]KAG6224482.1 hypothetical protein E4U34_000298 [Claviceps purpurea]KAG6242068.1 hypothetical protein E4U24_005850 [Claviceps purpurea]
MPCDWTQLCFQAPRREPAHVFPEPVEEARWTERLKYFHPTEPGQILNGRFKTIAKLGFGRGSTVWLAENLECKIWSTSKLPRYVSIKIPALDIDASDEIGFLKLILNAHPSHEGLKYIRVPLDTFDLQDIKDDNILTSPMTESDIKPFANHCKASAQPRYIGKDGRVTYASHDEIIGIRGSPWPRLADFNTCFPLLPDDFCSTAPIQSDVYRAPEVFLGIPWSYKVDIWNLGLMMWSLVQGTDLFDGSVGDDGEYDAHVHLAQMITTLGRPPPLLVKRERLCRENKQSDLVSPKGKECETMNEYWGGPFFDDDGCMIRKDLIKEGKMVPQLLTELTNEDKTQFLRLLGDMIKWLPERRKSAAELLKHPFFTHED